MWCLINVKSDNVYYVLSEKDKHVVSRSNGDLIIQNDTSISRVHAFLYPQKDGVNIVDAGSRYGTFLNNEIDSKSSSLAHNTPTLLKDGERVQFGRMGSEWKLHRINISCLTSTLTSFKDDLKRAIKKMDGTVIPSWNDNCTHLIMPVITVTPKLLQSLVACIPVVTPEYFMQCINCIEAKQALPDCDDYIPVLQEEYLSKESLSFKVNKERAKLFAGKTFIFMAKKHLDRYEEIIKVAGGKSSFLEKKRVAKSFLVQPDVIPIQYQQSSQSQNSQAFEGLAEYIHGKGRRLVPDCEIGLAILHCSIDRYCNPEYDFSLKLGVESIDEMPSEILAKDSADNNTKTESSEILQPHTEIPETETQSSANTNQPKLMTDSVDYGIPIEVDFVRPNVEFTENFHKKRKRTFSDEGPSKKQATEIIEEPPKLSSPPMISEPIEKELSQDTNSSGFLCANREKSPPPAQKTRSKRPLNLIIDDDDDNLFNFEETAKKRTRRNTKPVEASFSSAINKTSNENDDLFSFDSSDGANKSKTTRRDKVQVAATSTTKKSLDKSTKTTPTNKSYSKPIKITMEGWLSSSLEEMTFPKDEVDAEMPLKIKSEPSDDDDVKDKAVKRWFNGITNIFHVRVKHMNLTSKSFQNVSNTNNSTSLLNTSKNYKAFVKKQNYQPQRNGIQTKAFCVKDDVDDNF